MGFICWVYIGILENTMKTTIEGIFKEFQKSGIITGLSGGRLYGNPDMGFKANLRPLRTFVLLVYMGK